MPSKKLFLVLAISLLFSTKCSTTSRKIEGGDRQPATTADEAAECMIDLISGPEESLGDYAHLREAAIANFKGWLKAQLSKVTPSRREKIIDAIMRTTIDDSKLKNYAQAAYLTNEMRVVLRSESIGKILTFALLIHELDHLFYDLDSLMTNRRLRFFVRLADPRSIIFRVERRAHNTQYDFTTALIEKQAEPDELLQYALAKENVSSEAKAFIIKIFKVMKIKRNQLSINLSDLDEAALRANLPAAQEALGAVQNLMDTEIGDLLHVERQSRRQYFFSSMIGGTYKFQISAEYFAKAIIYYNVAVLIKTIVN